MKNNQSYDRKKLLWLLAILVLFILVEAGIFMHISMSEYDFWASDSVMLIESLFILIAEIYAIVLFIFLLIKKLSWKILLAPLLKVASLFVYFVSLILLATLGNIPSLMYKRPDFIMNPLLIIAQLLTVASFVYAAFLIYKLVKK